MKYSTGPWVLAKSGISVDAGNIRIRQEAGGTREEREANARLIAAAPDLFRACVEVVRQIDCGGGAIGIRWCHRQMKDAIAKAEGGVS